MARVPVWVEDAFTGRVFGGNPAAVCVLEGDFLESAQMQRMAAEHNLSETAFTYRKGEGSWALRWFTPKVEVDLCGHATLATAHVLWEAGLIEGEAVRFETRSGEVSVERRADGKRELDFPVRPGEPVVAEGALLEGLGVVPREVLQATTVMAVFDTEAEVRALEPDFMVLREVEALGVIATAPGDEVDFVSRFFAPRAGIDEDPVTGSAHCTLVPYWAKQLKKRQLLARQISARGGQLWCELRGDRVKMAGEAVTYLKGEVWV